MFKYPQSILCGLIAGLLFIPSTIFDMIRGVRYLQEGHGLDYGLATSFVLFLYAVAIVLPLLLKETGSAERAAVKTDKKNHP